MPRRSKGPSLSPPTGVSWVALGSHMEMWAQHPKGNIACPSPVPIYPPSYLGVEIVNGRPQ